MPTYEYECKTCGYNFETFQAITDEPVKICPMCGKDVRRLIFGGTGVIFKGSGFYVTDKSKGADSGKAKKSKPPKASPEGAPSMEGEASSKTTASGV